ncbi:TPA: type 1 fimbrial protein [Kluyvera cryocrescens]|uniref:fimbrial protein n=1 Tax=Kluyvera cryocrescens TaxID=580 RepID=UPI000D87BC58|nr:fimbrial protein [Kluyvera cryocrescens]SQC35198.1 putative fimbrial protein SthA [Kluyvera cryocrescens]HEP1894422.1 type 1 fimbrial protein [Kluyvera cryocrescens]
MKQKITIGSCLLISALTTNSNAAVVTSPAMPTGTLNIAGKIIDKGCTFEAKDFVIQLTPVVISTFTAVGDQGPKSDPVDFKLTGCPANTPLTFTIQGATGASATLFATATESTNATGFDFVLYGPSTTTSPIRPNIAVTLTPDASGNYNGTLSAQLRSKVAAPTAGKIDTTLTYTLAYN